MRKAVLTAVCMVAISRVTAHAQTTDSVLDRIKQNGTISDNKRTFEKLEQFRERKNGLLYPSRAYLPRRVRTFIEFIRQRLRSPGLSTARS